MRYSAINIWILTMYHLNRLLYYARGNTYIFCRTRCCISSLRSCDSSLHCNETISNTFRVSPNHHESLANAKGSNHGDIMFQRKIVEFY
jgi:hypothetical protein